MSDEQSKSWMSCLGWGCLTVVVVSVLGIGGCVYWVYQGGKGAHTVAESYLTAVDEGRYEDAFATLGADFTDGRDLAAFVAFEQSARAELGPCGSWKTRGTSFDRRNGRSVSLLRFVGECEGGPASVSMSLEQIEGTWVIQDIRYNDRGDEPANQVDLCPRCSGVVPPGARFCPSCGYEVHGTGAADVVETPVEESGE